MPAVGPAAPGRRTGRRPRRGPHPRDRHVHGRCGLPRSPALALEHRVVRLDLRGHGDSPAPPGPYASPTSPATSSGSSTASASSAPRSVGCPSAAWSACTMAANDAGADRAPRGRMRRRRPGLTRGLARSRTQGPRGGHGRVEDLVVERWGYARSRPEIGRLIRTMLAATPPEGYASCCDAIAAMDLRADLSRIMAPTLLLAGRDDPAAPPSAALEMAASIPDGGSRSSRAQRTSPTWSARPP